VRYAASVLRRLGYRVRIHLVPHDHIDAPLETIQVIPSAWGGDTPNGMLSTWFSCDGPSVHGWFCDPVIDRWLRSARALNSTDARAAAAIWARVDRRVVDEAAAVPMINERGVDFVSERVRNYEFNPYGGLIADQLWLADASR
jgi:peptide/nickel transport system substrate-binding protein